MTKAESAIPASTLAKLFELCADGSLIWRPRPATHFSATVKRTAKHAASNWNSRYAGCAAIACIDKFGHLTGRIGNRLFYAHRIVWAMHNGQWPSYEIDHINGKPADNRIENLRDVPHKQNLRNQSVRKSNTTGINGVGYFRRDGKWRASICVDGKHKHLGYFTTKDEAAQARRAAERAHGFHANHGRKTA